MLLLLLINDINLDYSQKELWEIALKIANNGTYDDLLKWIKIIKLYNYNFLLLLNIVLIGLSTNLLASLI